MKESRKGRKREVLRPSSQALPETSDHLHFIRAAVPVCTFQVNSVLLEPDDSKRLKWERQRNLRFGPQAEQQDKV